MATIINSPPLEVAVAQNFSLCIPRVFPNITAERIISIFEFYELGTPCQIDFVAKRNRDGPEYNVAYVHFNGGWKNTQRVKDFQDSVAMSTFEDPQKLIYDGPWFWIILQNRGKAQTFERERERQVCARPIREESKFQDPRGPHPELRQPTNFDMAASISPMLMQPNRKVSTAMNPEAEELKKLKRENLELKKRLAEQELARIEEELSRA